MERMTKGMFSDSFREFRVERAKILKSRKGRRKESDQQIQRMKFVHVSPVAQVSFVHSVSS